MICHTCDSEFSDQSHNNVRLSIVCERCATSTDLVTKTDALGLGATQADLDSVVCLYEQNPRYRNGADMQLYVREEIDVLAARTTVRRRRLQQEAARTREASQARQQLAKKSRSESLAKRLSSLGGVVPTPGLVSGDFCSVSSKTPKVGARSLLRRRALWNRLSTTVIPVAVQIFEWAVANKKTDITPTSALEEIRHEKHLFDRVATVEGHRVLSFLDEVDRLVLLSTNPVFREGLYALPVRAISDELQLLCGNVANRVNIPFARVLQKLEEWQGRWISRYWFTMRPERVATIMQPHFLGASKRKVALKRDVEEAFSRWGISLEGNDYRVENYANCFTGDVLDVELYTASCVIAKAGVPYDRDVLTSRVLSTPGATWLDTTITHIQEQLALKQERRAADQEMCLMNKEDKDKYSQMRRGRVCSCGNLSAQECAFGLCGCCCRGPCERHEYSRYGRYDSDSDY